MIQRELINHYFTINGGTAVTLFLFLVYKHTKSKNMGVESRKKSGKKCFRVPQGKSTHKKGGPLFPRFKRAQISHPEAPCSGRSICGRGQPAPPNLGDEVMRGGVVHLWSEAARAPAPAAVSSSRTSPIIYLRASGGERRMLRRRSRCGGLINGAHPALHHTTGERPLSHIPD